MWANGSKPAREGRRIESRRCETTKRVFRAIVRIFREQFVDQLIEFRRNIAAECRDSGGKLLELQMQNGGGSLGFERRPSRQQFEKNTHPSA